MRKTMTFKDWIEHHGVNEVAKLTRVIPSAVRHWRQGRCLPRPSQMKLIRKYSKEVVTYEEMIDYYLKCQAKKKRA